MLKAIVAALTALVFVTVVDILIWQQLYEAQKLMPIEAAPTYHAGLHMVLIGFVVVGAVALLPDRSAAATYVLTLILFGSNATADVLYYWLRGISVPDRLPWLDHNPLILFRPVDGTGLLLSCYIWAGAWALFLGAAWLMRRRQEPQPEPSGPWMPDYDRILR